MATTKSTAPSMDGSSDALPTSAPKFDICLLDNFKDRMSADPNEPTLINMAADEDHNLIIRSLCVPYLLEGHMPLPVILSSSVEGVHDIATGMEAAMEVLQEEDILHKCLYGLIIESFDCSTKVLAIDLPATASDSHKKLAQCSIDLYMGKFDEEVAAFDREVFKMLWDATPKPWTTVEGQLTDSAGSTLEAAGTRPHDGRHSSQPLSFGRTMLELMGFLPGKHTPKCLNGESREARRVWQKFMNTAELPSAADFKVLEWLYFETLSWASFLVGTPTDVSFPGVLDNIADRIRLIILDDASRQRKADLEPFLVPGRLHFLEGFFQIGDYYDVRSPHGAEGQPDALHSLPPSTMYHQLVAQNRRTTILEN